MNNLERREHLHRQLERRREVLAEWAQIGVAHLPEGTRVPHSINQVRQWDDPRLGISRIGSPSSFTTTHRVYGVLVREIVCSLRDLADQRAAQNKAKKTRRAKRNRRVAALERSLTAAANRYAVLSVELQESQLRLRVAEQSFATSRQEASELRSQVRKIEAEFARRSGSSNVTPIDSRRRDPP